MVLESQFERRARHGDGGDGDGDEPEPKATDERTVRSEIRRFRVERGHGIRGVRGPEDLVLCLFDGLYYWSSFLTSPRWSREWGTCGLDDFLDRASGVWHAGRVLRVRDLGVAGCVGRHLAPGGAASSRRRGLDPDAGAVVGTIAPFGAGLEAAGIDTPWNAPRPSNGSWRAGSDRRSTVSSASAAESSPVSASGGQRDRCRTAPRRRVPAGTRWRRTGSYRGPSVPQPRSRRSSRRRSGRTGRCRRRCHRESHEESRDQESSHTVAIHTPGVSGRRLERVFMRALACAFVSPKRSAATRAAVCATAFSHLHGSSRRGALPGSSGCRRCSVGDGRRVAVDDGDEVPVVG